MRGLRFLVALVLSLAPVVAQAQQQTPGSAVPSGAPPAASVTPAVVPAGEGAQAAEEVQEVEYVPPQKNTFDFGVRGTSITGDRARYERYRDLGNGMFFEGFRLQRQTANHWFLDAAAEHVGRLDQRFTGSVVLPGKLSVSGTWDQVPQFLSNSTRTLFTSVSPNELVIDRAIQTQVQSSAAALRGIADSNTATFDLKSRRYIGEGKLEYIANPDFTFTQSFRFMDRNGSIPYGGSFGHGNFVETFAPVNHRLTNWNGNGEYAHGPVLFRAGYVASFFHNDFESFTFSNPWRAADVTAGSSRGRSSLPPSNSLFSVNGLASVKLPGRSRASAYVSAGVLENAGGTEILPQSINSATTNLQALPRTTVDGKGRTTAVNLTFTSRPSRYVDVNARFRTYDYDNRTPEFTIFQRVAYDNNPSTLAATSPLETEAFGITRQNLDLDFRVIPRSTLSAGVGYSQLEEERSLRIFEKTTEKVARVTVDAVGTQWFSLRTKYEHSEKRGTLDEHAFEEMVSIGEQPGMRQFDIAPRDRDRGTILAAITATDSLSFSASVAAGHDDYLQSLFGMRDNKHKVYSAGFDAAPGERVLLSAIYTFEDYKALSRSRTANPGVQFTDETRNWATKGNDRVHTVTASAEIQKIAEKLDLRFSVDVSRAEADYSYVTGAVAGYLLPGESTTLVSSLPAPAPLPTNLSELGRGTADVVYSLTKNVGIGVTYWYEQYRVKDFTLDEQATPTLNLANSLLLGYLYRPYTANTVWGRIVYKF